MIGEGVRYHTASEMRAKVAHEAAADVQSPRRLGGPKETAVEAVANRLRQLIGRLSEANSITGAMQERLLGPIPTTTGERLNRGAGTPSVAGFAAVHSLLSVFEDEVSRTYGLAQRGCEIA